MSEIDLEKKISETSDKNTNLSFSVSENDDGPNNELEVNRKKEPLFRKFVYHELNERKQVPLNELINDGAEFVNISPITAKRYLDKMCSNRGCLEITSPNKIQIVMYKT